MMENNSIRPEEEEEYIKDQDRYLPIANVSRIMKRALPDNAKIAKDAKECVQECVSEFISFLTSEDSSLDKATDRCLQDKRKTINGDDIIYAMNTLGFENYSETLKVFISKFREIPDPTRGNTHNTHTQAQHISAHQNNTLLNNAFSNSMVEKPSDMYNHSSQ